MKYWPTGKTEGELIHEKKYVLEVWDSLIPIVVPGLHEQT